MTGDQSHAQIFAKQMSLVLRAYNDGDDNKALDGLYTAIQMIYNEAVECSEIVLKARVKHGR